MGAGRAVCHGSTRCNRRQRIATPGGESLEEPKPCPRAKGAKLFIFTLATWMLEEAGATGAYLRSGKPANVVPSNPPALKSPGQAFG